ncbi:MAG TPA: hypothetical protein VM915_05380 [Verrucomicrobiae bacterium]|nr:hypothetical protein [Verrucomicrobiae bacterium]
MSQPLGAAGGGDDGRLMRRLGIGAPEICAERGVSGAAYGQRRAIRANTLLADARAGLRGKL